jgi:hypothetical protein
MHGSFAQQIAITTYGNAFLAGMPGVAWQTFYPSNNTFTYCEFVRFVDRTPDKSWEQATAYADDPLRWFERFADAGVSRLRLVCGQLNGERISRWFIETTQADASDLWDCRWDVGDQARPDQRFWRVAYGRVAADQPPFPALQIDATELKDRFGAILVAIGEFARRHRLDMFAKPFASALAALNGKRSDWKGYDLAPSSFLPPYAEDLLAAAQWAWVFGGMGSWNDMSFEGDDSAEYARLTQELYAAVNEAVVVATNVTA